MPVITIETTPQMHQARELISSAICRVSKATGISDASWSVLARELPDDAVGPGRAWASAIRNHGDVHS